LRHQQQVWRYDKHHLVPFGEFIPPLFKWFTRMMNIPLGDFNRGAVGQDSFDWKGQRLAANICYEDLFGEELGVRFVDPALAPTIFVNVSNIGWFGDTVAIDQHLQISRMRALEFERPMVRATNTGRRSSSTTPAGWSSRCHATPVARWSARCKGATAPHPLPGGWGVWACGRCGYSQLLLF
jgi:apolipoprotein N-acyltransferase